MDRLECCLCDKIAADYGCEVVDILTGFKYIGEQIGILEAKGEEDRYIMGFASHGHRRLADYSP